jgi:hypothetical protein
MMRSCSSLVLTLVLLIFLAAPTRSQTSATLSTPTVVEGRVDELRGKSRARLLVIRSSVIDVEGSAKSAVDAVRAGELTQRKYRRTFNTIAMVLNKYMNKHGTITGVNSSGAVDFFIVFNLVRYRQILNYVYPSGELYVIAQPDDGPARLLWRTPKEMLAEDAAKKFVDALKQLYGQR